jgi:hypothetical protein
MREAVRKCGYVVSWGIGRWVKLHKNSTAGAVLSVLPAVGGEQNMENFGVRIKIPAGLRKTLTRLGGKNLILPPLCGGS